MNNEFLPSVGFTLGQADRFYTSLSGKTVRTESLRQYVLRRVADEWDRRNLPPRDWRFGYYVGRDSVPETATSF